MNFIETYRGPQTVWYDPKENRILVTDSAMRVWFDDDMFWKLYSASSEKERRIIKTKQELHEKMHGHGCEYLGPLRPPRTSKETK